MRQNLTPNRTFALHVRTSTAPQKQQQPTKLRHARYGVCERVVCCGRRVPDTTHEVLSWTRRCERAARKTRQIGKYFFLLVGALVPCVENAAFTKRLLVAVREFFFSWRVLSYWAQKRSKMGEKALNYCKNVHLVFWDFEIRILVENPLRYFQVACVCCGNAYARVLDEMYLRVPASPVRP